MLANISDLQSFLNIVLVGAVSFVLIGMGFRSSFRIRRGHRLKFSGATWFIPGVFGLVAAIFTAVTEVRYDFLEPRVGLLLFTLGLFCCVGIFLLCRGWRGVRVGDHPYCRACGFDLFGRPRGTEVCGECGASLHAPRAMVIGERRRRPFFLSAGLVIIVLTLAVGGGMAKRSWPSLSAWGISRWNALKSDKTLMKDVQAGSRTAMNEFMSRWIRGKLSNAAIETYLTTQLTATSRSRWQSGIAISQIREQWSVGKVGDALARQAMRKAMNLRFQIAPTAAAGECLRFLAETDDWVMAGRRNSPWDNLTVARITNTKVTVNDIPIDPASIADDTFGVPNLMTAMAGLGTRVDLSQLNLRPGQQIKVVIAFSLTLTWSAPQRETLTETQDYSFAGTASIVDAKQMYCTRLMTRDASATVSDGESLPLVPESAPDPFPAYVSLYARKQNSTLLFESPLPVVADLIMVSGEVERHLGAVAADASVASSIELDFVPPDNATFVLRPNDALGVRLYSPLATHGVEMKIATDTVSWRSE